MDNGFLNCEIRDMAGKEFDCDCGRIHRVSINKIIIGSGVVNGISEILNEFKGKKIFIVEDANTYGAAGAKVEKLIKEDFLVDKYIFSDSHLIPDERALGRLIIEIPRDTSLLMSVGSGSLNDLTRYLSLKLNIPYASVCTAPSMDGYASVVSPLLIDNVKTTYDAVYPYAIIADIEIMKEAPMNMIHAGFGDVIGKYTALSDWHLARILQDEYFCSSVEKMVLKAVKKCRDASAGIMKRDEAAIKSITEALILTGLGIGMTGSSRPASGEEHHLSHCWEMISINDGEPSRWLHGNNVGVGTGIIIEAYNYLKSIDIQRIYESGKYKIFDRDKWEKNLNEVYGRSAQRIIESKEKVIHFDEKQREDNMGNIIVNWEKIMEIVNVYLPKRDDLIKTMKEIGSTWNPEDMGIDRELFKKSFIAAKDIRKRYGILQLLEDIGELGNAAEHIANIYYN